MNLEELRNDISKKQKKGLPYIMTSVIIWTMITIVCLLNLPIQTKNLFVFFCSTPLVPIAWLIGKTMKIDLFDQSNQLGQAGFLFTLNQLLYLLIVCWVFNAVPEKMLMVFAMVFGAHLLPYSWLYKSMSYKLFAFIIPVVALVLGNLFSNFVLAVTMLVLVILFVILLTIENRSIQ